MRFIQNMQMFWQKQNISFNLILNDLWTLLTTTVIDAEKSIHVHINPKPIGKCFTTITNIAINTNEQSI